MLVLLGSAIHMSVFLLTSINNESKAPLCVPDSTAPQQHLLIVQGVFLSPKSKSSCEFIQFVIWCLTSDFSCKNKVKAKMEILVQKGVINTAFPTVPQRDNISHCCCSRLLTPSFPSYILYLIMFWDVAPSPYSSCNSKDHNELGFIQFFEHGNFLLVEYKTKFPQLLCG